MIYERKKKTCYIRCLTNEKNQDFSLLVKSNFISFSKIKISLSFNESRNIWFCILIFKIFFWLFSYMFPNNFLFSKLGNFLIER